MDFNRHMGNTAYLNLCTTVRMMHFAEQGVDMPEFESLHVGPVVFRDEIEYYRETHLLEQIEVTLESLGCSEDWSHFRLRNEIWRSDGTKAASVVSTGGWFDLITRKLIVPPPSVKSALEAIPRVEPFESLKSLIRR
jgi:acyl-CoA thioester hydrolase